MTLPTKITVIGAGSASFGENTLSAIMRSEKLKSSTLALVDRNADTLDIVQRLAERLNREWDSHFTITAHTHHKDALEDTDYVVSAIEVGPREELWKSDFEIPLKYGVRQPYAENGGPGGFAHAARNVQPVLEIVRDMEQACPEAWFINFTNPMTRICDLINRYSKIKAAGLCHQIYLGYCMAGAALAKELDIAIPDGLEGMHADVMQHPLQQMVIAQAVKKLDIRAAGLNHFTWILSIHDKRTGEDLYPLLRKRFFELEESFEPLTRRIFQDFGLFPVPGDTHLCEYLPWMSDPQTKPWERYNIRLYDWELMASVRDFSLDRLNKMASGDMTVDGLLETDSEGALEMIENIACAGSHYHLAVNLPNNGQISNLPQNVIVETPAHVGGAGIQSVQMGALPEPIAELCRREIVSAQLGIDAVVQGDYQKALQCLLLDPVVADLDVAKNILDDYLTAYKKHLPQFWK
ncbi:MAG: alpha-glucosidase/alpha-galactosidase [Anaerolineaceae bacterium]|nr:MAG: alpha-glucosidase/alpha-galactosidase [Anaerolineaceae bacterium]